MAGHISDLMEALRSEVDRIARTRAHEDQTEALSELLLESINKTLREIKLGARAEEFQELTIINFVVSADEAGYSTETIADFVNELKAVRHEEERAV